MRATSVTGAAAHVEEIAGKAVALHYGNVEHEYAALREQAIVVDRSARVRMTLTGAKAADVLTGLVTNDVLALADGQGCYAAALTPKGKIVADVRIFRGADTLLVDVPTRAGEGWMALIRKYVNPRLAQYADRSTELRSLAIAGTEAKRIAASITGISESALESLTPYAHQTVEHMGARVLVARTVELGAIDCFELFVDAGAFGDLWERALAAGAVPAGVAAWDIARIEAGRPEWGIDIDESTIPQEANFEELHAISYTKGCYTGQETVARVHFRGHVNRHLRGLRHVGGDVIPLGARLVDAEERPVGDVRSGARSPRLGGIALGMVRREIPLGAELIARWDADESRAAGEQAVTVHALPLPV